MSQSSSNKAAPSSSIGINVGFLATPIGVALIVEFFCAMLAWCLIVSVWWWSDWHSLQFAVFGFIFSWLCTLILLVTFILGLHGSVCSNLPWGIIQVVLNALMFFLCLIASSCVASGSKRVENFRASAAFGFIVTVLFVASFLLTFRKTFGRFPWQKASPSSHNVSV